MAGKTKAGSSGKQKSPDVLSIVILSDLAKPVATVVDMELVKLLPVKLRKPFIASLEELSGKLDADKD